MLFGKKSRKKKILFGSLFAIFLGAGFAAEAYMDHLEDQEQQREYERLLPHVAINAEDDFITKADKIRTFINANSEHYISDEFYDHWGKADVIVPKMLPYIHGDTDKKVDLECSSRTEMALSLYKALGYRARSVVIHQYADDYPSHTFLEVQNPETGKWHTQDPDFNVFWKIKETGKRASASDLIRLSRQNYHPCIAPEQCGWDVENAEGMAIEGTRSYFSLASLVDRKTGERPLLVNEARFDLDTPHQTENGIEQTYCEYREKNCRQDIIVYGRDQN